eukprot:g5078.t1
MKTNVEEGVAVGDGTKVSQNNAATSKPVSERMEECVESCCDEETGFKPCHCWLLSLLLMVILFAVPFGLVRNGTVSDEIGERALAFLPCFLVGLFIIPIYVYCFASRYSDVDNWGCGFGDYDEGPGNCGCAITSAILLILVVACFGGSAAAIFIDANPNSKYIGP